MEVIACGLNCTLLVDPDGQVWGCGDPDGVGHTKLQSKFHPINELPCAAYVSAKWNSNRFTVLDRQGGIWKCKFGVTLLATKFLNLPPIIMISCEHSHAVAIDVNGCLWGVGQNYKFQLGIQGGRKVETFTKIITPIALGRAVKVRCGIDYSIVLSETEDLWGIGIGSSGELRDHDGNVSCFHKISPGFPVQSFACGLVHTVALAKSGEVWSTGFGCYGALGLGDCEGRATLTKIENIPPMANVACGGHSTIMIDTNGIVYVTGKNQEGQLGAGHFRVIFSPLVISNLPKIMQAFLSADHSMLIDQEGGVWACGNNSFGQLGIENFESTNTFVKVEGMIVDPYWNDKRLRTTKRAQS